MKWETARETELSVGCCEMCTVGRRNGGGNALRRPSPAGRTGSPAPQQNPPAVLPSVRLLTSPLLKGEGRVRGTSCADSVCRP